jgi:hypothetical protein
MVCVICQDEISSTQLKHATNCAHTFHQTCWNQYIQHNEANILCPICKTEQTENTITLVIARSPIVSDDNSYQLEYNHENNESNDNKCSCSKHSFIIICLAIILMVISVACIITLLEN